MNSANISAARTTSRRGRRPSARVLLLLLLAPVVALLPSGGVRADTAPANPADPRTPVTVSADGLPTAQINGVGWEQTIIGDTVYVVGKFSKARPAGAAPGSKEVTRNNILAYDIDTGVLKTGFAPSLNAEGRAVTASPDGSVLYVGGAFTSVNGTSASRIVALDPATGAVIKTFKAGASSTVHAITTDGSTVWFAGQFTRAGGQSRNRAAAVDATTGALKPWSPNVNGRVDGIAVSPDGLKVVIGGAFTSVNGSSNPGYGLAALTSATAQLLPMPANAIIRDGGSHSAINSLDSDGTYLYGTGYLYISAGGQGNFEGMFALRWTDLGIAFMEDCHGDTYDAAANSTVVYTAGHAHACSGVGAFPDGNPRSWYRGLAFTRGATGVLRREPSGSPYGNFLGQPAASLTVWFPRLKNGTFTGQNQGPWSVDATDQYVVMAGEFPTVNGKAQQGLVRFTVPGSAPNKIGPEVKDSTIAPTVQLAAGKPVLRWLTNWDRDNQQLTYDLIRDGTVVVNTQSAGSVFWNRPTLSYTDLAAPSGTHTYKVRVQDPFGNTVVSPSVTVTVP